MVKGFESLCQGIIGQGSVFCVRRSCEIKNHKLKRAKILPNHLYVLKPNSTAFVEPSVPRVKIDDDLFDELKEAKLSLSEWTDKMTVIKKVEQSATKERVAVEEFYTKQGKSFKTPSKTSTRTPSAVNYLEITPYKRR